MFRPSRSRTYGGGHQPPPPGDGYRTAAFRADPNRMPVMHPTVVAGEVVSTDAVPDAPPIEAPGERPTRAEERAAARRGGRRRADGAVAYADPDGAPPPVGPKPRWKKIINYPRHGKAGWRRWMPSLKLCLGTFLFFFIALCGIAYAAYNLVKVPSENSFALEQSTSYYFNDGTTEIGHVGTNRETVSINQIPLDMQHAIVAAENRTFYTDPGFSITGTGRALLSDVLGGGGTQGGSTITQQYVKNAYLNQNQTLTRKFNEIFISIKLNQQESKSQILEGYLNTSYFGRGANGIEAAAKAYFGVDVGQLTVPQDAYLASLVESPSYFQTAGTNPSAMKLLQQRWNYVLNGMVTMKWVSPQQQQAAVFPTPIPYTVGGLTSDQQYMIQAANTWLETQGAKTPDGEPVADTIAKGGYKVTTSFDPKLMNDAKQAVNDQLMNKLDPAKRSQDAGVEVGTATIKPGDGAVLAFYGGADYYKQQLITTIQAPEQIGSTMKPLVLCAALEQDPQKWTPDTVLNEPNDTKVDFPGQPPYTVPNEGNASYGPISLTTAMKFSVNTVYDYLASQVGNDNVKNCATAAGISPSFIQYTDAQGSLQNYSVQPSFALGVTPVTPLDMADVYATFAANGVHAAPYMVASIAPNQGGDPIYQFQKSSQQVMSPQVASTITHVLQSVTSDGGTGQVAIQANGQPVAGKTGTTDANLTAWFDGYTPQMATAVELFRQTTDNGVATLKPLNGIAGTTGRVNGGAFPAQIWSEFTSLALNGKPIAQFPPYVPIVPPPPSNTPMPVLPSVTATPTPTHSAPPTSAAPQPTFAPVTSSAPTPTSASPTPTTGRSSSGGGGGLGGGGGGGGPSGGPTCGSLLQPSCPSTPTRKGG